MARWNNGTLEKAVHVIRPLNRLQPLRHISKGANWAGELDKAGLNISQC
jgi:hypothetical protein